MKKYILILFCIVFMSACISSGSEKTLENMAHALDNKDANLFLAQINMTRFATAQINNMTQASKPLQALDAVGRMLGLGGMEDLLGAVHDMKREQTEFFMHGVSTGELMLMCSTSTTPNCPWLPDALRQARMVEVSDTAVIAQITTPTNISSWLAIAKDGEKWKVVGQSALESVARNYALNQKPTSSYSLDEPSPPPPPRSKKEPEEPVRF